MKHSTFTRGKISLIAAAVIISSSILLSCNDDAKKTEVITTSDSGAILTAPVIIKDNVVIKDSLPKNAADSDKTEQTPPPRNH